MYSLPLTINDIFLLVSNGTNCLNLFHPIRLLVSITASSSLSMAATHNDECLKYNHIHAGTMQPQWQNALYCVNVLKKIWMRVIAVLP